MPQSPAWKAYLLAALAIPVLGVLGHSAGALAATATAAPQPLPAGRTIKIAGEALVYEGDGLYDYIDGGAPLFLEYGFRKVTAAEVLTERGSFTFDAYEMASPLAAWGLFSSRRPERPKPAPGLPHSSVSKYQTICAWGPYYFEVSPFDADTSMVAAKLIHLAVARLPAEDRDFDPLAQEPLSLLPPEGLLPGSQRLARGPVSLRAALGARQTPFLLEASAAAFRALARTGAKAKEPPWWAVALYHPGVGEEPGTVEPQTVLLLCGLEDPVPAYSGVLSALGQDARGSGSPAAASAVWSEDEGTTRAVLAQPGRLMIIESGLDSETIREWLGSRILGKQGGTQR